MRVEILSPDHSNKQRRAWWFSGEGDFIWAVAYAQSPFQTIRTVRGILNDYIPRWVPFRSFVTGPRYKCFILDSTKENIAAVEKVIRAGKVVIDSVWSFGVGLDVGLFDHQDAKKAFEKLESARAVGKIVIEVD